MKNLVTLFIFIQLTALSVHGQAVRISDINPGSANSYAGDIMVGYNGFLYTTADDGVHGRELWKYDGDTLVMSHNIRPGSASSYPDHFAVYNNRLYFSANDGVRGNELWCLDGDSLFLVEDLWTGSNGSNPRQLRLYQGKLFFVASANGSSGIWSHNGDTTVREMTTTSQVMDSPSRFTDFNGALYAFASDDAHGLELWRFDGDTAHMVADIRPGSNSSFNANSDMIVYDGMLYLSANDGISGTALWSFDGDTAVLVADINPGMVSSTVVHNFAVYDGKLYFSGNDGVHGTELWGYDGTSLQMQQELTVGPGGGTYIAHPFEYAGKLYFQARNESMAGMWGELFRFDGSSIEQVAVINSNNPGSDPRPSLVYDNRMFFSSDDGIHGYELWSFTDTSVCSAGFTLVPDPEGAAQLWYAVNTTYGQEPITYSWDWGDGSSSSGAYPTHLYDAPGYYNICVTMTDAEGCSDTYCDNSTYIYKNMDMIAVNVLDQLPIITQTDLKDSPPLVVFPNPNSGMFRIDLGEVPGRSVLNVFNDIGALMRFTQVNSGQFLDIELPGPTGIYFVQIMGTDGTVRTSKVVKE